MPLIGKITGYDPAEAEQPDSHPAKLDQIADGALDTLGSIIRVMGDESFQLDKDFDPAVFPQLCKQFAGHVENGGPVPSFDIQQSADGSREWALVRRFFADRRHAEKSFVTERLENYRGVVEDMVTGLRQIGERDQTTKNRVIESLSAIEDAVSSGATLPEIEAALTQALEQVTHTFAEQKRQYEAQLDELNGRMSNLRQDLVAAREEMKRDALTDAYNRGAFDTALEQSLNLHFILNQPVTLVMVDLDNFKQVNDTYGHAAGDQVLRAIGECLTRTFIRKGDLVARYGGDEFAVILNDTSVQHSTKLVDRFLQEVTKIQVTDASDELHITCSAGYTEIHEGDTAESIVGRADRALYQAKAAGRNVARILMAEDEDER